MSSSTMNLPGNGSIDGTPILVPTTLEGAGAYLNARSAAIAEELESLKTLLAPISETWTGKAAADYLVMQSEWDVGAQGLFGGFGAPGVLGEIAQAMGVNWGNYTDAEFANTKTWANGTPMVPGTSS